MLGIGVIKRHYNFFPKTQENSEEGTVLRVSSININSGQYLRKDKNTLDDEKMRQFFKWSDGQNGTDIILAQEKRYFGQLLLDSVLQSRFTRHGNDTIGTGIYTTLPIVDKGFLRVGGNTNYAAWADLRKDDKVVRVYSFHGSSNMISKASNKLIKAPAVSSKKLSKEVKSLFENYAKYSEQRNQQYDVLIEHIKKSPNPVILGGDFNDVPQSFLYQRIGQQFDDVFTSVGKGIGVTYKGPIPGLRIDYVFVDQTIKPLSFKKETYDISDHYPIMAEVIIQ